MSDTLPSSEPAAARFRPIAELLGALQFLTRLPIPFARTIDPVPLAVAMRAFPLAGALIGALTGLFLEAVARLQLPEMMTAALGLGFSLLLTGALHEDGLADTADGLFGGATRERRLEIMRDSRIGTYGACALGLALLSKASAFTTLLALPPGRAILVLAATGAFSRAMVVDMMWATRPARSDGLSALAGRPSRNTGLYAIITGGAIALVAGAGLAPLASVAALCVAVMITGLMRRLATQRLGGQTGDVCGAVQVLVELGMLAAFLSRLY